MEKLTDTQIVERLLETTNENSYWHIVIIAARQRGESDTVTIDAIASQCTDDNFALARRAFGPDMATLLRKRPKGGYKEVDDDTDPAGGSGLHSHE